VSEHDRITANLPARDFDETRHFYEGLGFDCAYRDNGWMIMSRGALEIEFFPYPDINPFESSFSACIRVADLDRLFQAWLPINLPTEGIPRLQGPAWTIGDELRMFALIDPNGSLLRCLGP
jgi:catechol 2,3-dioxygenase-like lactoylglutathione lyase family enzyme